MTAMTKPLEHVRILDLTQFLAGSYCTMLFAGMGAEVIKIERPGVGEPARSTPPYAGPKGVNIAKQTEEDISLSILKRCRGKKGITLNLRTPEGKELFLKMVEKADVVVENYRPGTMEKLGLDYPVLAKANPAIVYCSLTGFGAIEAYKSLPAFDIVIQALSGAMSTNGQTDGPPTKNGLGIADEGGGLFACIGILAALEYSRKTGQGQQVTISMMESVLSMLMDESPDFWLTQGMPLRSGNRLTRLTPFNSYQASDGYFVIASGSNAHWEGILKAMGREDLIGDKRYADISDRIKCADEVDGIINDWAKNVTVKEAIEVLNSHTIPCAPVREIPEVYADENLIEAKAIVNIQHPTCGEIAAVKAAGNPLRFSLADTSFDKPAPTVGQHNLEIYQELCGLSEEKIKELIANKII
jgi:crotonobetainyl-CoA:carnitine CoA-transferase CaiB-like acyl-CoA transferase